MPNRAGSKVILWQLWSLWNNRPEFFEVGSVLIFRLICPGSDREGVTVAAHDFLADSTTMSSFTLVGWLLFPNWQVERAYQRVLCYLREPQRDWKGLWPTPVPGSNSVPLLCDKTGRSFLKSWRICSVLWGACLLTFVQAGVVLIWNICRWLVICVLFWDLKKNMYVVLFFPLL